MGWRDTIKDEPAPGGWRSTVKDEAPQESLDAIMSASRKRREAQDAAEPKDVQGAFDAFRRQASDSVPLVSQGVENATDWARGKFDPEGQKRIESDRNWQRAKDQAEHPTASAAGAAYGSLGLPSAAMEMKGVTGAGARIAEQAAVAGGDAKLRGEDWKGPAAFGAGMAALPEAIRLKTLNRLFGGVPEEIQAYYLKDRAGVDAAREVDAVSKDAVHARDTLSDAVSEGSGDSYRILKDSGYQMPLSSVNKAIDETIETIRGGGAYDDKSVGLIKKLEKIRGRVVQDASLAPEAKALVDDIRRVVTQELKPAMQGMTIMDLPPDLRELYTLTKGQLGGLSLADLQKIPAAKVKSLITQIRKESDAYKQGVGVAKGTEYNLGAVRRGTSSIDQELKDAVPEYRTKMEDVAAKTEAFKGVANKLSNETSARNAIRRMMLGKDPEGLKALKDFDEAAGTGLSKELQDSYVKEQFTKERTNGSRRTVLGRALGGAAGAALGGVLGSDIKGAIGGSGVGGMAGYASDVYGGRAAKALLDLSQTPYLGAAGQMLAKAFTRGGVAGLAMHRWLMDNDNTYRSKIEALKEGDAAP